MVEFRYGVAGDDLLREYGRARLFLSGSYTECQPLVLLDAMATGTPFVARATGCISRLPGGVAVRSPAAAADEVSRLLADAHAWEALAGAGTTAAAETYSLRRNTDLMMQLLQDMA
jgi:glycosyltransferase involved in cell wall biosynthesis